MSPICQSGSYILCLLTQVADWGNICAATICLSVSASFTEDKGRPTLSLTDTISIFTMKFLRCGIHAYHETLGIDADQVRMFWALQGTVAAGEQQIAYRLCVALSKDDLVQGSKLLWDTGKVSGNCQRNVPCEPDKGFQSTTFHYWRVTVWNEDDTEFHSPVQEFFTAYPRCSGLLPPYSMNQTYVRDH